MTSSRRVLTVSFLVDLLDVVTNLAVSVSTGSAVIFGALTQGVADCVGSLLLVIGERRARRPRDAEHPLGYGREVFFWALLSAVMMLFVGAGLTASRAYAQFVRPRALERPTLALAVLALAILTSSYALTLGVRKVGAENGGLRAAFRAASRPLLKTALLRAAVGLLASVLGLIALVLYVTFGVVVFDAIGALVAALLMAVFSIALIAQARGLITGRTVPGTELERIRLAALRTPGVVALNRLAAVYASGAEVQVELDLDLAEKLDTTDIERVLDDLQGRVRRAVPEVRSVRVDLNSPEAPGADTSPS